MIRASYCRDAPKITVTGHAGSAPHGHDLVCAGVSTLVYTLAFHVQKLERAGLCANAQVRLLPGDAEVACTPLPGQRQAVTLLMGAGLILNSTVLEPLYAPLPLTVTLYLPTFLRPSL